MNYDFIGAYRYAKNVNDLFKRCISYNALIGQIYQGGTESVGNDIILSLLSALYGPVGNLTSDKISEVKKFLDFLDRGFERDGEKFGSKLERWLNCNARTQNDIFYFEKMWDELISKCDEVYSLLCSNYNIPAIEILKEIINPATKFDWNKSEYQQWIYV